MEQGQPARRIEYVPLSSLKSAKSNPKKHADAEIKASFGRFGYVEPIVLDERTGTLVAGHGRSEALRAMRAAGQPPPPGVTVLAGEWIVPVLRGWSSKNDKEAGAYLIASNRLSEAGQWDDAGLAALLKEAGSLEGTGFSADDFSELLAGPRFTPERVALSALKAHPKNYRKHPEDQLAHLVQSIKEHGFYRNVVIARDNTVLAGHGVVQAATKLGRKSIPVVRMDLDPHEPRAMKVLTSDNEISNLAETDDRALTEMLKSIMDSGGLEGTGFNEAQLAALAFTTRPASEVKDKNEAAEWAGMPEYEAFENPFKVIVSIRTEEQRAEFLKLVGYEGPAPTKTGLTSSIWYPSKDRRDLASLKFTSDARLPAESEKAPSQHPPDLCDCGRALDDDGNCEVCDA